MNIRILCIAAILLFSSIHSAAQGLDHSISLNRTETPAIVALSHPLYNLLEQAYSVGAIRYLPQIRPYTLQQISNLVSGITDKTSHLYTRMSNLLAEENLSGVLSINNTWDGGTRYIVLENSFDVGVASVLNSPQDTVINGRWSLAVDIGLGTSAAMGLRQDFDLSYYSWVQKPFSRFNQPINPDMNLYTYFLTQGIDNFNSIMLHVPGETDLTIFGSSSMDATLSGSLGKVSLGRGVLDWGPSAFANLALSRTAAPYEYLTYAIDIAGKGTFTWMTGFLHTFAFMDRINKMITAHRFEYQVFPWLLFGIYESVVYQNRFEISYMNPLALYYISEVYKGDRDNKLGGIDLIARIPETKLYLSLFADDWDFNELFSFNYYHNIWSVLFGIVNYSLPRTVATLEFAYLSHWMYTHLRQNVYEHWGRNLGFPMDPNGYTFRLNVDHVVNDNISLGLTSFIGQSGVGSINSPLATEQYLQLYGKDSYRDLFYNFLDKGIDGIVIESFVDISPVVRLNLPKQKLSIAAELCLSYTKNKDNILGNDLFNNYLTFSVSYY